MKRLVNFRIDVDLMDRLEAVRDRDGIPVSEQVRRAMLLWLDVAEGKKPEKPARKRAATRQRA